jgi:hypothetical protein
MKNIFVLAIVGAIYCTNAFAFDKIFKVTESELEDFAINQNNLKLNNFTITEKQAFLVDGLVNIEISCSATNKNNYAVHFSVMVVGYSDNEILWGLSIEPMMSTLSGNSTETVTGNAYITPGLTNNTKNIWIRIVGAG